MNTTESRPFAAALAILKLAYHPPAECGTGGNSGLDVGRFDNLTGCQHQQILSAIRGLEAAGEMPQAKERLLPHFEELAHIQCFYCKGIRAILAALPDKEK